MWNITSKVDAQCRTYLKNLTIIVKYIPILIAKASYTFIIRKNIHTYQQSDF